MSQENPVPEAPHRAELGIPEDQIRKAARLRANGISEKSAALICKIPPERFQEISRSDVYCAAYELACAQLEVQPAETEASIQNLERIALRETISNVQSGLCDPATILDALKYATKVRLEEKKLEQDRQQSFTANTQVVINLSDMLRGALERSMSVSQTRTVEFTGESKSVINGMDTNELLEAALGTRPEAKDQARKASLPRGTMTRTPISMSVPEVPDLDDILLVEDNRNE